MLITYTSEPPALSLSGWRASPARTAAAATRDLPRGPRGAGRAMDRMAAVLEILDVTDTLVRDRQMTLPAGLRQFAAGASLALAGEPAPDGVLAHCDAVRPRTGR